MPTARTTDDVVAALRRAAVRAALAPSVRNSQPWRFVLRGSSALEIHADWSRWLRVLDGRGQQLLISCGAAALNARVSLAASGYKVMVERFPRAAVPDLVARLTVTDGGPPPLAFGALDTVTGSRRTNRQPFTDEPVPDELGHLLVGAAAEEGAHLIVARRPEQIRMILRLTAQADVLEQADPGYRAELRAWAAGDLSGRGDLRGPDRSGASALDPGAGSAGAERRFIEVGPVANPCLMILGSDEDTPASWARTGEALQRVLLEITRRGYAVRPLTQAVEVASTRGRLREHLGLSTYPQTVLRVGRAPSTVASRRRRLVDVFSEEAAD